MASPLFELLVKVRTEGLDDIDKRLEAQEKKLQAWEKQWGQVDKSTQKPLANIKKNVDDVGKSVDDSTKKTESSKKGWLDYFKAVSKGFSDFDKQSGASARNTQKNLDGISKSMGVVRKEAEALGKTDITLQAKLNGGEQVRAGLDAIKVRADDLDKANITLETSLKGNEQVISGLEEIEGVETRIDGDTVTITMDLKGGPETKAQIDEIQAKLNDIDGDKISATVDLKGGAETVAELQAINAEADHVDGRNVTIKVDKSQVDSAVKSVKDLGLSLTDLSKIIAIVGLPLLEAGLGAIPALASEATAAVGALTIGIGEGLAGAVVAGAGAFASLAAGIGLTVAPLKGITQAYKDYEKAQEGSTKGSTKAQQAAAKLTEAQNSLFAALDKVKDQWKVAFEPAQTELLGVAQRAIELGSNVLPQLGDAAKNVADSWSSSFDDIVASITNAEAAQRAFQTILDAAPQAIYDVTQAAGNLGIALVTMFGQAVPYGTQLLDTIRNLTLEFAQWTQSAQGIDAINTAFAALVERAQQVWDIGKNLVITFYNLGQTLSESGLVDHIMTGFQNLAKAMADATTQGTELHDRIVAFETDAIPILDSLWNAVKVLVEQFFRMAEAVQQATDPNTGLPILQELFQKIADLLPGLADTLINAFVQLGPTVVQAVEPIAQFLEQLVGYTDTVNQFVSIIGTLAGWFLQLPQPVQDAVINFIAFNEILSTLTGGGSGGGIGGLVSGITNFVFQMQVLRALDMPGIFGLAVGAISGLGSALVSAATGAYSMAAGIGETVAITYMVEGAAAAAMAALAPLIALAAAALIIYVAVETDWSSVGAAISDARANGATIGEALGEGVENAMNQWTVGAWLETNLLQPIRDAKTQAQEEGGNTGYDYAQKFIESIERVVPGVQGAADLLTENFSERVAAGSGSASEAATEVSNATTDSLDSGVAEASSKGTELVGEYITAVSAGSGRATYAGQTVSDAAIEALDQLAGAQQAGQDTSTAYTNAIQAGATQAQAAAAMGVDEVALRYAETPGAVTRALQELSPDMVAQFRAAHADVANTVAEFAQVITTNYQVVADNISTGMAMATENITSGGQDWIDAMNGAIDGVTSTLDNVGSTWSDSISSAMDAMAAAVSDGMSTMQAAVDDGNAAIQDSFDTAWSAIVDTVTQYLTSISDAVTSNYTDGAVQEVEDDNTELQDNMDQSWSAMADSVDQYTQQMLDSVQSNYTNGLVSEIEDDNSQLESDFDSSWGQIYSIVDGWINKLVTDVQTKIQTMVNNVNNQLRQLAAGAAQTMNSIGLQGAARTVAAPPSNRATGGIDKNPEPQPSVGGVSSGLAPRIVYGEQSRNVQEAYIVEDRPDNLPYLAEAASWFGMGLHPVEGMARGGKRRGGRRHRRGGGGGLRGQIGLRYRDVPHYKPPKQKTSTTSSSGTASGGSTGNAGTSTGTGGSSGGTQTASKSSTPDVSLSGSAGDGSSPTAGDPGQCGVFPVSTPTDPAQQPFTDAALQQQGMGLNSPVPAGSGTGMDHVNVPDATQAGGDACGATNSGASVPDLGSAPSTSSVPGGSGTTPSAMPACGPSTSTNNTVNNQTSSTTGGASSTPGSINVQKKNTGTGNIKGFAAGGVTGTSGQTSPVPWTQVPIGWWEQFLANAWVGQPSMDFATLYPPPGWDPSSMYTPARPSQFARGGIMRHGVRYFQGGGLSASQIQAGLDAGNSMLGEAYAYGDATPGVGFDCAGIWNWIESAILYGSPQAGKRWGTGEADAGSTSFSTPGNTPEGANIGVTLGGGGGFDDTHMAGDIGGTAFESTVPAGVTNGSFMYPASAFPDQWTMGGAPDFAAQLPSDGGTAAPGGAAPGQFGSGDPSSTMNDLVNSSWNCSPAGSLAPATSAPPQAVQPYSGQLPGLTQGFLQGVGQQQLGTLGQGSLPSGTAVQGDTTNAAGGGTIQDWATAALEGLGMDPTPDAINTIVSLANQESGGNPNATGANGEYGLMQLMPDTWATWGNGGDPYDPVANITASIRYQLSRYGQLVDFSPYAEGGLAIGEHLAQLGEAGKEVVLPLENRKVATHVQSALGLSEMGDKMDEMAIRLEAALERQSKVMPARTGEAVAGGMRQRLVSDQGLRQAQTRAADREAMRRLVAGVKR